MSIKFIPVALVVGLFGLVAVGGAALAFGLGGGGGEHRDDLLERAAAELGIQPEALKDAFAQAESDIAAERRQEVLDRLVDGEVITQEQADEASAWLDAMPDAARELGISTLHDYGKSARPGRKLGHITVVADSADGRDTLIERIRRSVT